MNVFANIYNIKRVLMNTLFSKYFKAKSETNTHIKNNFKDLLDKGSKSNKSKFFKGHISKH